MVAHKPEDVRRERERCHHGEGDRQPEIARCAPRFARSRPCDDTDRAHDDADGEVLPQAHRLAEHSRAEGQEEQQAEGEGGLHERQGSMRKRQDLQRPADHGERDPRNPGRPSDQGAEERRAQRMEEGRPAGFECLRRVADLVASGCREGEEEADSHFAAVH